MYKSPEARMTAARTRLLLDFPWFGSLAMRLAIEPDASIPTFQTNGTVLKYNPETVEKYTDPELTAIVGHEVMHCALLHPFRRGNRDRKIWNQACDYSINPEIVRSGMKLPADALIDPQYDGLSADVIYAQLAKNKPQPDPNGSQQSQGNAGDQGPSTGEVSDAPADAPGTGDAQGNNQGTNQQEVMTEADWKIAAEQANDVAKGCGKLPGGVEEKVKQARANAADWRAILRDFVEHTIPSDYSWTSPNRRHVANGIYLPGMIRENLGHIVVAVDTSGSIDEKLLAAFCTELNAIVNEARADGVTVLYCDTKVQRKEEFQQDEEITLTATGRGGTAFQPVFDEVSTWDTPPVCLIYFTDLDSSDTPAEPDYPVLWATDLSVTQQGPFGQTVRIAEL